MGGPDFFKKMWGDLAILGGPSNYICILGGPRSSLYTFLFMCLRRINYKLQIIYHHHYFFVKTKVKFYLTFCQEALQFYFQINFLLDAGDRGPG